MARRRLISVPHPSRRHLNASTFGNSFTDNAFLQGETRLAWSGSRAQAGDDASLRARAHQRNGGMQRSDDVGGGDRVINSFRLLSGFFSGFCPFRDVTRALLRLHSRERAPAATRVHAPRRGFCLPFSSIVHAKRLSSHFQPRGCSTSASAFQ